ncbi:hypothetical protein [Actinotalea sp. K2]|uniref:hypothetical protein n=1 Tax=Actinotalea sp. K2 TaxID=2939438 RepID=UPI002017F4BA|nr:hypothetical protein [Actinotalea sp. K2]MCL3861910.1 hypothetical protein [Actinotalea sp. K2]
MTRGPRPGQQRRARLRTHVRATRSDLSLRREADMMAFYLGLTLLVALNVTRDEAPPPLPELLLVIWGTTVGLAVAHWFALTLAAFLVRDPNMHHTPGEMLMSQVVMAGVLAIVASVAVVLVPVHMEVLTARVAVALFIGVLVTMEARSNGSALPRALAVGVAALGVAMILATIKLALK